MNLSFTRFFKKDKTVAPPAPPPPIEKPASERYGKTVMPNASRVVPLDAPRPVAVPTPPPAAPQTISLGGASLPRLAPRGPHSTESAERTVALQLSDLLAQIPAELLETSEVDPEHRVIFNASEIERGMATGRPTVSLRAIYQQAPMLFASEVSVGDPREITLPFNQVLLQFANFQVRDDQVADEAPPQVETPFLKVTLEDSEKFGTRLPSPRTLAPPPVVAPPPPAAIAAPAVPKPATKVAPPSPIRLSLPPEMSAAPSPVAPSVEAPVCLDHPLARAAVQPKIFPNGTGVLAERVPASSGSPVPIPFAPPPPARIPFKISPPSADLCPPPLLKPPALAPKTPLTFSEKGPRLRLPLRAVLRGLPPFQFAGAVEEVAADAFLELPFAIVEPQLSLGRIAVSPAQFQAALPEKYRSLFQLDDGGLPVALPLQEVLQNLPNESLQLRADQEEVAIAQAFETPFSQKAAEDAARLKAPSGPIAKGANTPLAEVTPVAGVGDPGESDIAFSGLAQDDAPPGSPISAGERTALQVALDTDDVLDPKSIVAHASRLPGMSACAIVFSDGLSLAGNIPAEHAADALCAMAPSIVKRIDEQMSSTNFGALQGITIFCAKAPVSFFAHGNICLVALHSAGEIAAETRDRLGRTAQELARMYAQPA